MDDSTCIYCGNKLEIGISSIFDATHCNFCSNRFTYINRKLDLYFLDLYVLFLYDDAARDYLYRYKGLGDVGLAEFVRVSLVEKVKEILEEFGSVNVIGVPSSSSHIDERGFDHIEIFLDMIQEEFIEKYRVGILKINKATRLDNAHQGKKSLVDRRLAEHVFEFDQVLENDTTLVLDDVCTTGTTFINFWKCLNSYNKQGKIIFLSLFTSKNLL